MRQHVHSIVLTGAVLMLPLAAAWGSDADTSAAASITTPAAADALSDWVNAAVTQAQLQAGQVIIHSGFDAKQDRVNVDAAIRVLAGPQAIWPLITRCEYAALLIPGLKGCKQLDSAPDGSWAVVEHDTKLSFLLPMLHSVFRADYHAPYRMDFHRLSGDMKSEAGTWLLQPAPDGTFTTIEYRVALQPGALVPHGLVRHLLNKQLPASLLALRDHAERPAERLSASIDDGTARD